MPDHFSSSWAAMARDQILDLRSEMLDADPEDWAILRAHEQSLIRLLEDEGLDAP